MRSWITVLSLNVFYLIQFSFLADFHLSIPHLPPVDWWCIECCNLEWFVLFVIVIVSLSSLSYCYWNMSTLIASGILLRLLLLLLLSLLLLLLLRASIPIQWPSLTDLWLVSLCFWSYGFLLEWCAIFFDAMLIQTICACNECLSARYSGFAYFLAGHKIIISFWK